MAMGETGVLTRVLARKFGAFLTFASLEAGRESAPGQLTLADIHAALAYYHDHREEIRQQMRDAEELVRTMIRDNPPRLPQKLPGESGRDDTVPSG